MLFWRASDGHAAGGGREEADDDEAGWYHPSMTAKWMGHDDWACKSGEHEELGMNAVRDVLLSAQWRACRAARRGRAGGGGHEVDQEEEEAEECGGARAG